MTDAHAPVPDHIRPGLRVLFIGFNPSLRSGETGHNYANPNNRFWRILQGSGLTPRLYRPEEDGDLLELGYGFTNIVARPTRAADEITREEYREGRSLLRRKLEKAKPRVACYVGKGVYEEFRGSRGRIPWGFQEEETVNGVKDFVAPSSSGLVRMKLEEMIDIYKELEAYLNG
ncbi:mismatch-specific DNA-glycosylase [Paenibacillus aurantius]|uniref:Mismatch-specific DNA-glycosylase n=1 Tax=Paenibacillus aurantius TaxID=2918900 RepID=A0AA96LIJ2_9BACL|nr:mismatch-specific DNA-glycosylase [Paenibacillus aurantius]WNQ13890.1 mismatch-specific DNA-glycosylase [Paenibacillus aurantius]